MPTNQPTYQCRHIFNDGHRCGSPCLRTQKLCYHHHTTRRPALDLHGRRARGEVFEITLPGDHPSVQIASAKSSPASPTATSTDVAPACSSTDSSSPPTTSRQPS